MLTTLLAENTHNFVRVESLRPASLEAVALLAALVLAWRRRSGGLLALYAITLPFNDVVYRLGPLTPSDLIGIAIIFTRFDRRDSLTKPLVWWLAWGGLLTILVGAPVFSVAYSIRFAIILIVAATVPADRGEARTCVEALSAVTVLAGVVAVAQVVLWKGGLPIDGVFAAGGFVRPKVLSHEPSTAALWFAFALPLLWVDGNVLSRRRRIALALAIAAGLATTASLSGIIATAVFGAVMVARSVNDWRRHTLRFASAIVVIATVGGLAGAVYHRQVGELTDKVGQYVSEYTRGSRPLNVADVSGREGDLALLDAYPPGWAHGSGLFTASALASGLEGQTGVYAPASNIVITTALETGIVGLVLFMAGMFVISIDVARRHRRKRPAFLAGFLAFEAALVGQRFLAFPQPWFMLGLARALASGEPQEQPGPDRPEVLSTGRFARTKESVE